MIRGGSLFRASRCRRPFQALKQVFAHLNYLKEREHAAIDLEQAVRRVDSCLDQQLDRAAGREMPLTQDVGWVFWQKRLTEARISSADLVHL